MEFREINNRIPNSFSEMKTGVFYYVSCSFKEQNSLEVVQVLLANGFSQCFVNHPPYSDRDDVIYYITIEGDRLYSYCRTRKQKNAIPNKVFMSREQFLDYYTKPKEIDHEAIDFYEATRIHCEYTPAIQATATKLIAHGYRHEGVSENNDNVIIMNHEKKTFSTTFDISRLNSPRVYVKVKYPGSPYKEGGVIELGESDPRINLPKEYPDIFSTMSWWQKRSEEEMPSYLKHKKNGTMYKVKKYIGPWRCFLENDPFGPRDTDEFLPATKEEYKPHLKP
jgi:hypothetical protein